MFDVDKMRIAQGDPTQGPMVLAFRDDFEDDLDTPAHSHGRGQLMGCERGIISMGLSSGSWVVPAGHALWLPPGHAHSGRTHGPFSGWSAYLSTEAGLDLPEPFTARVPALLREAIRRAVSWDASPLDERRDRIARLIVDELHSLSATDFGLPMPADARLRKVAQALLEHPEDRRGIEAWARWAGTSTRTLSRRFPVETGFSLSAWRQRARLLRALEMLADGTPVTTIAFDLGYGSVSAFIALFKRTFGTTPAAYAARRPVEDLGSTKRASSARTACGIPAGRRFGSTRYHRADPR
ncbi:AraC family transcriptional regulator [Consotaella aegiceratis]|uniref:AraC family transcriptional regulator n=1 Tax=Consotaella aegiceratis TaxID=3097961 RepID=UPI002F42EFC0